MDFLGKFDLSGCCFSKATTWRRWRAQKACHKALRPAHVQISSVATWTKHLVEGPLCGNSVGQFSVLSFFSFFLSFFLSGSVMTQPTGGLGAPN